MLHFCLFSYTVHGEWTLLGTRAQERSVKYSYSDGEYSVAHYHFEIRRQTLYYMMNFIVPCILIAVLTVPVLLLPPESQERQSYGVTVLLSFTILIMMLQVRGCIFSVNLNSNANWSMWNGCIAVAKTCSLRDIRVYITPSIFYFIQWQSWPWQLLVLF